MYLSVKTVCPERFVLISLYQGERRFWLGAMVDDHFVDTNVFQYNGIDNEGDKVSHPFRRVFRAVYASFSRHQEFQREPRAPQPTYSCMSNVVHHPSKERRVQVRFCGRRLVL